MLYVLRESSTCDTNHLALGVGLFWDDPGKFSNNEWFLLWRFSFMQSISFLCGRRSGFDFSRCLSAAVCVAGGLFDE
jgi:hypothetical protein